MLLEHKCVHTRARVHTDMHAHTVGGGFWSQHVHTRDGLTTNIFVASQTRVRVLAASDRLHVQPQEGTSYRAKLEASVAGTVLDDPF